MQLQFLLLLEGTLCSQIQAAVLALWLSMTFLVVSALASGLPVVCSQCEAAINYPCLFGTWQPVDGKDWQVIGVLAVLMLGIGVGLARAYQSPHPQVIATFDYAYLIFAAFGGYVFFGEVPDRWTLCGIALIVATSLIAVLVRSVDIPADGQLWNLNRLSWVWPSRLIGGIEFRLP